MEEQNGNVNVSATETKNTNTEVNPASEPAPAAENTSNSEPATPAQQEPDKQTGTEKLEIEDYVFEEKYNLSDEQKQNSLALMKSFGMTKKEQAQKFVDFLEKYENNKVEADKKATEDMLNNWDAVLVNDKEFSKNYDANIEIANKALKQYGSEELEKWLDKTGFNRNPEIVKLFYRIGKDLEDAKVLAGNNAREVLKHDRYGNATFNFNKSFGDN